MKKVTPLGLCILSLSALFGGCVAPEPAPAPEPIIVERHHYHTDRVYVPTPVHRSRPAPAVRSDSSAEGFRAVEKPVSYSQ